MMDLLRARRPFPATLAAIAAFSASSVQAQEDRGDILVVGQRDPLTAPASTGSRLGLTPLETPASIAVIDGDEIRARGDVEVIDAVSRAPGITNVGNPGNGNTALAARGFGGQGSVLQLVDGVRLFPVAGTITFPTDPWTVDRIEVLSGPASVLYGQGALGGAVNVITRKPDLMAFAFEGEAGYGSQDSWHLAAGAGGPIGRLFGFRLDASYRQSDGYVDRGDFDSLALSGAVALVPSSSVSLTLRNDYGKLHPMEYFGTPLIAGELDDRIRHENYNVGDAEIDWEDNRTLLTLDWAPSDTINVTNTVYRLTSKRLWRNLESYCWIGPDGVCPNEYGGGTPGLIYRADNFGILHDQVQYGNQGSARLSTPLGALGSNDLVVGFDINLIKLTYSHNFGSDFQEDEVDPFDFDPGLLLDTQGIAPRFRTRTNEYALFAEDRLKLNEQLSIVGGIRYERDKVRRWNIVHNPDGTTDEVNAFPNGQTARIFHNSTWRVGAVYRPTPAISLYGQYSTGVDPLGTLTTYTTSVSQFFFTNAKGDQIEAGVKAVFLNGRGSATLAAYRIVKNDLVAQRTPNAPVEQVGQRSAKGIEAALSLDLPRGFGLDANGTILDADYDDFVSGDADFSGNTPPGVPQTAANLWLRWSALERFQARAGLRYVGRRFSDDANAFRVPGYTVVDGGLSYALTDDVALDFRVYNLFDKDYAVTTYIDEQWILGRPRSVDFSVRARF
jgi:iron complex outermembrane recepter protein